MGGAKRRPRGSKRSKRVGPALRALAHPTEPGALSSDSLVIQPCEIVRGVARPRGWPSCFPPCRRVFTPSASRGGGAPIGASVFQCTPLRGRARPLGEGNAAPLGAPHGVGRPAGSRFRLTARFQQLRWAWPSPGSERIAWSRCAPGRIPEPLGPRACKARRRKRRTPLRLQMPLEAPSSERGWWTICSTTLIVASGTAAQGCERTPEVVQRF